MVPVEAWNVKLEMSGNQDLLVHIPLDLERVRILATEAEVVGHRMGVRGNIILLLGLY